MKKFFYLMIVVIFVSVLFSACNNQPVPQKTTTTVNSEKVTYSNQGFYVEQQTIVRGNTVWGISEKIYGTGLQWRDIVALNPFLNTPDRLYYNPDRKMWIVRIYPGEVLNIGGQKVYPSCTYENTTTVTTIEPVSTTIAPIMPWWGWVLIGLAVLLLLFFPYFRNGFRKGWSSASSSVVINNGNRDCGSIDADMRNAFLTVHQREIDLMDTIDRRNFRVNNKTMNIIRKDSKRGRLDSFYVQNGDFCADVQYRERKQKKTKENKNEPKIEEK